MSKHLLIRNGHFYYRQWIPLDLRNSFEGKVDITTSLKTMDKQVALTLIGGLQQKYQLAFTLLRSGTLSKEHEQSIIYTYTLCREKPTKRKSVRLSELIISTMLKNILQWKERSSYEQRDHSGR